MQAHAFDSCGRLAAFAFVLVFAGAGLFFTGCAARAVESDAAM